MRPVKSIAAAISLATAALVTAQAPIPDAAKVVEAAKFLAATRNALGGESRLAAVRTFVARGRTQQVRGNNLVPIEFEIDCDLPDKYRRTDEIPAQESGPTSTGFNGDALIQVPALAAPPGRAGPPTTAEQQAAARAARVAAAKQDFARLMLGMFAGSFRSYPLTFAYAGRAEAPQGQADVIDVKGPADFALRLFVHSETHLPIMVTWQAPAAGRGASPPIENRLYYADYRETDGLRLPFRMRRSAGPDTVEEMTFDSFRINPKIDPKTFATTK
jgi:hypothetical protein